MRLKAPEKDLEFTLFCQFKKMQFNGWFCLVTFYISQIFWINSSNQEKRRAAHLRLGRVKPKSITLTSQTMKANTAGRREFRFWKPKGWALPRRTRRRRSRMKTNRPTPPSVNTTIIITHYSLNTPQMSAKRTHGLKTAMWSLPIVKSQERAQVSLCHTRRQTILSWTCLCLYRLTAA